MPQFAPPTSTSTSKKTRLPASESKCAGDLPFGITGAAAAPSGAWSFVDGGGRGAWREPGSGANAKAGFKWRSYKGALKRQEDGGIGWLAASKSRPQDEFVPFAFEVGGALGDEAEGFLRECAAVADHCRRGVGDLMHWSAMTWGGHWRQRIGVEIFKGVARCVERAASGGRVGGGSATGRTQEWDPHCC